MYCTYIQHKSYHIQHNALHWSYKERSAITNQSNTAQCNVQLCRRHICILPSKTNLNKLKHFKMKRNCKGKEPKRYNSIGNAKTILKIYFLSKIPGPISIKLDIKHFWTKGHLNLSILRGDIRIITWWMFSAYIWNYIPNQSWFT